MRNKKKVYFLIIAFLLIFLVFIFLIGGKLSQNPLIASILNLPIPVYVVPIVAEDSTKFIGANATSESSKVVKVSFPSLELGSQLRVVKVLVKVSYLVKKEQPLATLKNVSLQEEINKVQNELPIINSKFKIAKENLEEKKNYFSTIKALYSKNFATKLELESARDNMLQAEIGVGTYQQSLIDARSTLNRLSSSYTELDVLSPIEGVVLEKDVEEGEVRSVGSTMFSIGEVSPLYVVANVSQEDKDGIYLRQEAEVSFNFLPGITYKGSVIRIDPSVDVQTQTFKTWLSLPNVDKNLLPGSAAFVRFNARTKSLVVPRLAVVGIPDEPAVFVVDDNNKAYLRRVVLGTAFLPNKLEVIKGLREGEKVATFNLKYLKDGSSVLILNKK